MAWLDDLRGKVVAVDTTPLIYFIEENPKYAALVQPFFQSIDAGEFVIVMSVMTMLEVLVHPNRTANSLLAERYKGIFVAEGVTTVDVTASIAESAARLRATHSTLRAPDASQLATALSMDASFFLTNDKRLPVIPGLQILRLDELIESQSTA